MKVGNTVRCIDSSSREKKLTEGKTYEVLGLSKDENHQEYTKVLADNGAGTSFFSSRFIHVSQGKPRDWEAYSFEIRARAQLDPESIREDLSADDPLMIVEFSDSKLVEVFIHDSIWTKAMNSGEHCTTNRYGFDMEEYRFEERLDRFIGMDSLIRKDIHLSPLIKLIKEIKAAAWEKPRKAKVTVRRITI